MLTGSLYFGEEAAIFFNMSCLYVFPDVSAAFAVRWESNIRAVWDTTTQVSVNYFIYQ